MSSLNTTNFKYLFILGVLVLNFNFLIAQVPQDSLSLEDYRGATKAITTSFFFIGSFFVMGIYMLLFYIQSRKRDYLLYSIYLLLFSIYFLLRIDEVARFNIIDASYTLHNHLLIPMLFIITSVYVKFINIFAEIKSYSPSFSKRLDIFCAIIMVVGFGLIVYILFTGDFQGVADIRSYLTIPMHIYTLAALIRAYIIIKSAIRNYIFWSNLFLFTFSIVGVYSASSLTYDETLTSHVLLDFYTFNASQLGTFLEMICFSLGLGYKFSLIEKENDEVKEKYIHELKKNEEVSRQLNEELARLVEERTEELSRKNLQLEKEKETKSNFFANISHEFRTPITLILGPIQNLIKKKNLSSEDRGVLEMIRNNSNKLLHLVDQLLGISKLESKNSADNLVPINLKSFFSRLLDGFQYAIAEKNINFNIEIKGIRKVIIFDEDSLNKITTNLLSNALKYTPENKEIYFTIQIKKNLLVLEIKNTGVSIPENKQQKIFKRFYRIKQDKGYGIGIGLALVKELVTHYKGKISVTSKNDEWTKFRVALPVLFQENNSDAEEEVLFEKEYVQASINTFGKQPVNKLESSYVNTKKSNLLLLIDDNREVLLYLTSLLKSKYDIITAENGKDGIKLAKEKVPDLIISDIMMPFVDGIELSKKVKEDTRTSHIPIILLTARADYENELKGIRSGAEEYVVKPFNNDILLAKIETLLSNRYLLWKYYFRNEELSLTEFTFNATEQGFVEKLQEVVEENFSNGYFTAKDFAEELGMSRMQFHRKIKAVSGMSALEYLNRFRLKNAANLLSNPALRISDIAFSTGFNDANYFSKVFKNQYQMSPTEYRSEKVNV